MRYALAGRPGAISAGSLDGPPTSMRVRGMCGMIAGALGLVHGRMACVCYGGWVTMARPFARAGRWARYLREVLRGVPEHCRERGLPPSGLLRRIGEQSALLISNNITAHDYYVYGLYRGDLSRERKREFVGDMERWRWQQALNPADYLVVTQDKAVLNRYLGHAGIPVARLLGVIGPDGYAVGGQPVRTTDDLRRWLAETGLEHMVFKPVRGSRGTGILIAGKREAGALAWERVPGGRLDFDDLVAHLQAHGDHPYFLVEERLWPHEDLARFSPDVLHTARVVTTLDEDVGVVAAALKINIGSEVVDNFSQGNLAASIDLETGRLGPALFKQGDSPRVRAHPVTGAEIEGFIVPDWSRLLAMVRAAALVMPFNPCIGWDVALTTRGPMVVEANGDWDYVLTQLVADRGLLGTALGPYLARRGAIGMVGLRR
jgi:hypothetical protein